MLQWCAVGSCVDYITARVFVVCVFVREPVCANFHGGENGTEFALESSLSRSGARVAISLPQSPEMCRAECSVHACVL